MISIIIPTLQEEYYIGSVLTDLSKQTNDQFEVIVVDADSEDGTVETALSYKSTIPMKIISTPKRNAAHQRNLGVKYANGETFVFLDADISLPNGLVQTIAEQDKGDAWVPLIKIKNPKGIKEKMLNQLFAFFWKISPAYLSGRGGCIAVKREIFSPFNEQAAVAEDIEFTHSLRKKGKVKGLDLNVWESPRRYRKEGVLKTLLFWILNGTWQVIFNTSYHKEWKPVR